MMQVMQLKIRELPPLSIDDAIATGFRRVKASKAYMMQVMQLKIRELPPLSIDDAIATGFPKVKASKAYLNDAGDAAQNSGTAPINR